MIANPNSTSQDASVFRQVYPRLREAGDLEILVKFTHYPGHAGDMVRGLKRDDFEVIIALGGDGTVNEVVNGLLGTPGEGSDDQRPDPGTLPVLGVIPTGSANVFVRALGFPGQPVEAASALAETIYYDLRRTIRLGTWQAPEEGEAEWFAVNAGFGLDADVLAAVDKKRARGLSATPGRYLWTALRGWSRALRKPPHIDAWATDGTRELKLHEVPLLLASNTNPWTFLGPLPVVTNPRNSFDKGLGLFGLRSLRGPSGFAGLLHLFGAHKLSLKQVIEFDDAQEVTLRVPGEHRFQADGELQGKFGLIHLHSIPDALEVYAP